MIAWKSLQLLLLFAMVAVWSNAQAQEANGSQLQPVYSPANPKGGWKVKTQETRCLNGPCSEQGVMMVASPDR